MMKYKKHTGNRINWGERLEEFKEVWDKSNSAHDVAVYFKCNVGQVYTAKSRWKNSLNLQNKTKVRPWTDKEDKLLVQAVENLRPFNQGYKKKVYEVIRKDYLPDRTTQALKNRVRMLALYTGPKEKVSLGLAECKSWVDKYPAYEMYCLKSKINYNMPRVHQLIEKYGKGREWTGVLETLNIDKNFGGIDLTQPCILYYICIDEKYYKIGITSRSLSLRFGEWIYKTRIRPVMTLSYGTGMEAQNFETDIKREFKDIFCYDLRLLKDGNTEIATYDFLGLDYESSTK